MAAKNMAPRKRRKAVVARQASTETLRQFRSPSTVIGRFVTRRSIKQAVIWGSVFALTVVSSAVAYVGAYATPASRQALAATFGNNVGLKAILGASYHLETVAGFTAWRSLGLILIVGAIWAILTATKTFRGEEAAGRWELFLAGQVTARRAAAMALAGLAAVLVVIYAVVALTAMAVGSLHTVQFSPGASLFFALAAIASPAEFLVVGALASQIMPTRSRAAGLTTAVFGLSFGLRAIGNVAGSTHWLLDVSPLGWVQQLRPLIGSQPLWLLPIALFVATVAALAIFVAGQRDLDASILADRDTAKPKLALLVNPLGLAVRLMRATTAAWLAGLLVASIAFSALAKTAGQAFDASASLEKALSRISQQTNNIGAATFLGIIFLFLMTILMLMVANALSTVRDDEAQGYIDNLLTRPVARTTWLAGRLLLIALAIIVGGLVVAAGAWLSITATHGGILAHDLLLAGINTMPPAFFLLGVGTMAFGFRPRLTSAVVYGLAAWSFLLQMLGSIGNINHYLLDTSILHHIALAPAVAPNWASAYILFVLGLAGCIIGTLRFTTRDLQNE